MEFSIVIKLNLDYMCKWLQSRYALLENETKYEGKSDKIFSFGYRWF